MRSDVRAWLRSWKGGLAVAAGCVVLGLARAVDGHLDGLTWTLLPIGAGYALAAVVDRRVRRAASRPDPMSWTTHPSRLAAWLAAEPGRADHPGRETGRETRREPLVTRDRVGAFLAVTASVVGLVLVLQDGTVDRPATLSRPEHPSTTS